MPSGPHTKNANVLAASRTSATSSPRRAPRLELLLAGVDQQRDVVQQRPIGLAPSPGSSAMHLSPTLQPRRLGAKPSVAEPLARCGRVGDAQHDVVDVVVEVGVGHLDQAQAEALGCVEGGEPVAACARSRGPPGSAPSAASRSRTRSTTRTSAPGSRGPSAANSVSLPRRASAPTSVKSSVRSISCMPRCVASEVRERVAVGDPERDMVEGDGVHRRGTLPTRRPQSRGLQDIVHPRAVPLQSPAACRSDRHGPPRTARSASTMLALVPASAVAASRACSGPCATTRRTGSWTGRSRTTAMTTRGTACGARAPAPGAPAVARPCAREVVGHHALREALPRNYSLHSEGRALDWHLDARNQRTAAPGPLIRCCWRRTAPATARARTAHGRAGDHLGLPRVVVGRRRPCATRPATRSAASRRRHVNATIAHRDHIHIGLNRMGAARLTSFWRTRCHEAENERGARGRPRARRATTVNRRRTRSARLRRPPPAETGALDGDPAQHRVEHRDRLRSTVPARPAPSAPRPRAGARSRAHPSRASPRAPTAARPGARAPRRETSRRPGRAGRGRSQVATSTSRAARGRARQRLLEAEAAGSVATEHPGCRAPAPAPAPVARPSRSPRHVSAARASHAATAASSAHEMLASSSPNAIAAASATARGSKRPGRSRRRPVARACTCSGSSPWARRADRGGRPSTCTALANTAQPAGPPRSRRAPRSRPPAAAGYAGDRVVAVQVDVEPGQHEDHERAR